MADVPMIRLKVDASGLQRMVRAQPVIAYRVLRDYMDHCFRSFRKHFIQRTGIRLSNRSVAGINAGLRHAFVFTVQPFTKEFRDPKSAAAGIPRIRGEAYTNRPAMAAHEKGATIRARGKLLRVPIRIPGTPQPGRGRRIVRRTADGRRILFEVVRRRTGERQRPEFSKSGKLRKTQRKTLEDQLVPRAALRESVQLKPRLRFHSTWDSLEGDRAQKFARAASKLVAEVERAV